MPGLVKQMDKALGTFDLARITSVMDKFSEQFEDLEVQSETMNEAMAGATSTMTPESDVAALIAQVCYIYLWILHKKKQKESFYFYCYCLFFSKKKLIEFFSSLFSRLLMNMRLI